MRIVLTFLLCLAAPAMAQCVEPQPPVPVDGNAATENQMRNTLSDARSFITQSEMFQSCLNQELADARTQAAAEGHPLDPAIEVSARARIAASRKAQDQVGQASNMALTAYKNAHSR